jgi:hypothetical protein
LITIIINATVDVSTPPSFVTVLDAKTTSKTTRRVPLSTWTRISSPVMCTAKMLYPHIKSVVPTCATRKHPPRWAQTTTASAGKTVTSRIITTVVATTSHAGATILPCPARARLARAAQAKRRRIIISIMMVKFPHKGRRLMCPLTLRRRKKNGH